MYNLSGCKIGTMTPLSVSLTYLDARTQVHGTLSVKSSKHFITVGAKLYFDSRSSVQVMIIFCTPDLCDACIKGLGLYIG